jgi:hypothetical protein
MQVRKQWHRQAFLTFALMALPVVAAAVWTRSVYFDPWCQIVVGRPFRQWTVLIVLITLLYGEWRGALRLVWLVRGRDGFLVDDGPFGREARRTRIRTARFRLAAVGIAVAVAFGFAELVFHVFDIQPAPIPRHQDQDRRWVDNTRNSLGLREKWETLPEKADDPRLRVAFLGDSFTYGEGVEPDQTFSYVLNTLSADAWQGGVLSINLGEPATGPGAQLEKYLAVREAVRPDVLVHVIYLNDLGINPHRKLDRIYRVLDADLWVGTRSRVLRYGERQVRYWIAWNDTLDYFRGGSTTAERRRAWDQFETDVRRCRAAAEEAGTVYCLALFPWIYRLHDYPLHDWHVRMKAFAERLGVPYVDLLDAFLGLDDAAFRISAVNEHPNPAGHRLAAERLNRFLREVVIPTVEKR